MRRHGEAARVNLLQIGNSNHPSGPNLPTTDGTSETVITSVPTIMFAENGFGPGTNGPDFAWVNQLQLQVTVLDSSGNVLQTASTMIQTQIARDIILP